VVEKKTRERAAEARKMKAAAEAEPLDVKVALPDWPLL
jgi:hypothetical protein